MSWLKTNKNKVLNFLFLLSPSCEMPLNCTHCTFKHLLPFPAGLILVDPLHQHQPDIYSHVYLWTWTLWVITCWLFKWLLIICSRGKSHRIDMFYSWGVHGASSRPLPAGMASLCLCLQWHHKLGQLVSHRNAFPLHSGEVFSKSTFKMGHKGFLKIMEV